MTHLWPDGESIAVEGGNVPAGFRWQGQRHTIEVVVNRWRVDTDWWAVPIWREYFQVTTDSGLLVTLYHDLLADDWKLQRLYD
jgi:hypothetical protein